jgi:hypothetical protein
MAFLAAETFDFGNGDAGNPKAGEGFTHLVELEGFDDGGDKFHNGLLDEMPV